MKKDNFKGALKHTKAFIADKEPAIMVGLGIAGFVFTAVATGDAAIKADKIIKDEIEVDYWTTHENESERWGYDISFKRKVELTWKLFVPPVLSGILSAGLIIGGNSIHVRRSAAMAAAYEIAKTSYDDYREAVIGEIGEKKEKAVHDRIAKKKIESNPVSKAGSVVVTDDGNTLCYDALAGRYFRSDIGHVQKAVNLVNHEMLSGAGYVSLNDFYDELNLDHSAMGDELGWNTDDGLVDVSFSSQLADDGTPCLVIEFVKPPKYNFDRYY